MFIKSISYFFLMITTLKICYALLLFMLSVNIFNEIIMLFIVIKNIFNIFFKNVKT